MRNNKNKVDKTRIVKVKRKYTKRKEKTFYETNSKRINRDNKNSGRKRRRGRFYRDQNGRINSFQKVP